MILMLTAPGKATGISEMAAVKAVAIASRRERLIFTAFRRASDRTPLLKENTFP